MCRVSEKKIESDFLFIQEKSVDFCAKMIHFEVYVNGKTCAFFQTSQIRSGDLYEGYGANALGVESLKKNPKVNFFSFKKKNVDFGAKMTHFDV